MRRWDQRLRSPRPPPPQDEGPTAVAQGVIDLLAAQP